MDSFYALFVLLSSSSWTSSRPTCSSVFLIGRRLHRVRLAVGQDRRLKIILAGCAIAVVTYFPLFPGLTQYVNPDLEAFQRRTDDGHR